jgi:Na+/proline symporter
MANQVSAGATIGIVGFHYYSGFSYAWSWPLTWAGWMVCAFFVAPKIRRHAGFTLPDFFAARYDSRAARAIAAVFILVAYTVMLSAQYQAGGLLFTLVSGLEYSKAVILVAAITTAYTMLGGMYSNAYVGMLKAVLLLAGYFVAVPFLWQQLGGLHAIGATLHAIDPRLTANWFGWRQLLSISGAVGLGLAAAPYEISAIYSMQSQRATQLAIGWSFFFQAFIGVGVLVFGLSMRVAVPHLPDPDLGTPMLGTSVLPFGAGLLVLLAAVVTFTRTGGAILLTAASAVSHDLYGRLLAPQASEAARVRAGRIAVVLFSAIPVVLAFQQLSLVNFIVIYAARLMVSFLFVPVVFGLNWKRATAAGAMASMLGGLTTCLVWSVVGNPYFLGLDPAEAGVLVSAALFFGVSVISRPVGPDAQRVFFPPASAAQQA